MRILIILTLICEAVVGVLLLFAPQVVPTLAEESGAALNWARMYGAAAISIAVLCFWVLKKMDNHSVMGVFFHVIIDFQILVIVATLLSYFNEETAEIAPAFLHGAFLIAYVYFYMQRKKNKPVA